MTVTKQQVRRALEDFVMSRIKMQVSSAEVKSVNENASTCTVYVEETEIEYEDVELLLGDSLSTFFLALPEVGSTVMIGFLDNEQTLPVVVGLGKVEKVIAKTKKPKTVLLGKGTKSACIAEELNTNLAELVAQIAALNALLTTYSASQLSATAALPLLLPLAPGYTALQAGTPAILTALQTLVPKFFKHLSQEVQIS